jgi:transposase
MPRTRNSHPPSRKAKVAVEAIKAHKTTARIAHMFGGHPTQVGGWKKQALAGCPMSSATAASRFGSRPPPRRMSYTSRLIT